MNKARIEAFSDGVIAIIITIMVPAFFGVWHEARSRCYKLKKFRTKSPLLMLEITLKLV